MVRKFLSFLVCATVLLVSGLAIADGGGSPQPGDTPRILEFRFTPVRRAQVALWIERTSPTPLFQTLRLTEAVARRGIGNRPGATQMNSGFRWPYGRREGVLPVWAHRRVAAGELTFPRVIFRDRTSEGAASQAPAGHFPGAPYRDNPDDYFCLSFRQASTNEERRREALDAVSCASTFNSDKGRYITSDDVAANYSEPMQVDPTSGTMRPLSASSLYPPRRDVECPAENCGNHPDVSNYATDAASAMPEIDLVSTATLADREQSILFTVPEEWPEGEYVAYLEINVEGDYTDHEVGGEHPIPDYATPQAPAGSWDSWAISTGYPYRGQPSVVYAVPFGLNHARTYSVSEPAYQGSIDGNDDDVLHPLDGSIVDDPIGAPGSGADRLIAGSGGERFAVRVQTTEFFGACTADTDCEEPQTCDPESHLCALSYCAGNVPPSAMQDLNVEPVPDEKHSHQWGHMSFSVPSEERGIQRYDVRVSTSPITDEDSFLAGVPANAAAIDTVELVIPTAGSAGDSVAVDFGGLMPQTRYYVGIRAIDVCNAPGPIASASLETTPIHFTTVSPCFVATAAYGSPLANEIGSLRRFRDRHLMNNALGRSLVSAYYSVGPSWAAEIREHESLRTMTRWALSPIVHFVAWLDAPSDSEP